MTSVKKFRRPETVVEEIDTKPYAYSVRAALDAFSFLSESELRKLIREDKIAVRYKGRTIVVLGDSLRRYVDSLPTERQVHIECAAQRDRDGAA